MALERCVAQVMHSPVGSGNLLVTVSLVTLFAIISIVRDLSVDGTEGLLPGSYRFDPHSTHGSAVPKCQRGAEAGFPRAGHTNFRSLRTML